MKTFTIYQEEGRNKITTWGMGVQIPWKNPDFWSMSGRRNKWQMTKNQDKTPRTGLYHQINSHRVCSYALHRRTWYAAL